MASRRLTDLKAPFRGRVDRLIRAAAKEDLDILVYCTFRSFEEQARLFRQGRSLVQIRERAKALRTRGRRDLAKILLGVGPQYGPKVTNAAPGQSAHNYGLAIDAVPIIDGKALWGTTKPAERRIWAQYGTIAQDIGLDWSGNWRRFREMPHVQAAGFRWQDHLLASRERGRTPR